MVMAARREVPVLLQGRGRAASGGGTVRVMIPAEAAPDIIRYRDRLYVRQHEVAGKYVCADVWPIVEALDETEREKETA